MTEEQPTISIVMPTYQRGKVIERAVRSVLQQSYDNWQLIIVDDGSTDSTQEVVARFADSRITYVRHEANRGCAAARNTGLSAVRGDLVSFLDSDDTWKREKLRREVSFLNTHNEVQGVFSDLEKFDGDLFCPSFMRETAVFSKLLTDTPCPEGIVLGREEVYYCLLQEAVVKTPAVTLRTEAVRRTGLFNESMIAGSDWEYFIRFARTGRFGYIDWPLVIVEVRSDSTHRCHFVKDKIGMLGALREERRRLLNDPSGLAAVRDGIADSWKHLAWRHQSRGERFLASVTFLRGFCETWHIGLFIRSLAAILPSRLRGSVSCAVKDWLSWWH